MIAIGLPCIAISSVINGYFTAVRKAYKSAISQVLELFIKILLSIILLKYSPIKNVELVCIYLILADIISEIFSVLFLFILYKIDISKYLKRMSIKTDFKNIILRISLPVAITSYIRSGLSTLKQFIVPNRLLMFGLPYTIALAEYGKITGMALPVIMFPTVFIGSFSNLIVPEFSSLLAKGYKKRIITILSPLIIFMYIDNIIDNMLKGLNQQFKVMFCNIIDLIISISILYILLPKIGITGFIIAIYVSEIFNFTVSYITLKKTTGFKIF